MDPLDLQALTTPSRSVRSQGVNSNPMKRLGRLLLFAIGIGAVTWLVRERVLAPAPVDTSPAPGFRTGSRKGEAPDPGDPVSGDGAADEPAIDEPAIDDLTLIVGVGPTYRDRLTAAGVTTLAELAGADPERLAEQVGAGPGAVAGWVEQARERTT